MSALVMSADEARVFRELDKAAEEFDWNITRPQLQLAARIACRAALRGRPKAFGERDRPSESPVLACGVTEEERDVLVLIAAGFSNREIGTRLDMPQGHAERRVRRLYAALGAVSRPGLVAAGRREGLLPKVGPGCALTEVTGASTP